MPMPGDLLRSSQERPVFPRALPETNTKSCRLAEGVNGKVAEIHGAQSLEITWV